MTISLLISGVRHSPQDAFEKKSRLSPSFQDVIKDHDAIPYLIQYLETCKGAWLIRFWLDAESFQASTWTRIRTHSLHSLSKSSVIQNRSGMKRSRSLNQDITSPTPSIQNPASSVQNNKSARDRTESCSDINMSGASSHNQLDESVEISEEICSPEGKDVSECDSEDKSGDVPTAVDSTSCSGNAGSCVPTNSDCDSRDRERCKSEDARSSLTLPLNQSGSDNSEASGMKRSESAISYRDITTPSPTRQEATAVKPQKTTTRTMSREGLAEKLKKSEYDQSSRLT